MTPFSFSVGEDKLAITIKLEDLFTTGTNVDGTFETCYVPIFRTVENRQDTWILGNIFMQQYYTVFNMESMTIGLGP